MVLHRQTARLRCHDVHSLLLEVHEYKGNLGLNETSHVGAPIGDSIELQPGEGARELAWSLLKAHHKAKPHEDPYRNKPLPWNPAVVPW